MVCNLCLSLVALSIIGCPQKPELLPSGEKDLDFNLGRYHLVPQNQPAEFADLDPLYRLVSFQNSGYWLSSDTGLSYVVSEDGQVTQVDQSNMTVSETVRVYATANDESWQLQKTSINHSLADDAKEVPAAVRVLWFGEKMLLAYGDYQLKAGNRRTGIQVIKLNENNQIDITAIRLPDKFADADKYLSGGIADGGNSFWLWTRSGGLLVASYDGNKYGYEERATIDLPKIDVTVKDFGFPLIIADKTILPPAYVLAITSQTGNRGAVYLAPSPETN